MVYLNGRVYHLISICSVNVFELVMVLIKSF